MMSTARIIIVSLVVGIGWTSLAAAQQPAVPVTGVVQDATTGGLPGATVDLIALPGLETKQTTAADSAGSFRFDEVTPGAYEVIATFEGFKPARARVRVGARPPRPVTLVLPLADFTEEITISNEPARVQAEVGANINATVIDQNMIENLPVFGRDVLGTVSRFLDAGAFGTGGATIIVDGVELSRLNVPVSEIQQIKINRDPYAAEFSRPGSGRIEVITKPGSRTYRGTATGIFRDSALDAAPALAAQPPEERHYVFEGFLGGPVWHSKKTSFTLTTTNQIDNRQAIVVAYDLAGKVQENVPTPYDYRFFGGTINHQYSSNNSMSLRLWYESQHQQNRGVGGTTLPEAGSEWDLTGKNLAYSHQTILTPRLVHQVRVLVGSETQATNSVTSAQKIVVVDAFSGGGAQADQSSALHHFTLTDTLSWSKGRHLVKAGINIPEWGWHELNDRTNRAGTYYFSSLDDYAKQHPYSFIQQRGNGYVRSVERVLGVFTQDEIQMSPRLSLAIGLRYDWQNYFSDSNNFAPRAAFAFAPTAGGKTVIRGGAGLFYDRTGAAPIQDLLRYDGSHLQQYVVTDPSYPAIAPGQLMESPPNLVRVASNFDIASRLQYSAGIEHQLNPRMNVSVNYTGARGFDMFRSRDINTPMPPDYQVRPDPLVGVLRQIESAGHFASQALQVSVQARTPKFNGSVQYTLGTAHNDTSGINWMPPNSYDLSGEYARADFNQRNRFDMVGTINSGSLLNIGFALALYSGKPYSITTGHDDFNTGLANARPPGVPRNSADGPDYADLDLHWSYDVWRKHATKSGGPRLNAGIDAFNVLNRVNYSGYVGTITSPFFGTAVSTAPPRRLQLSLKFTF